MQAHWIGRSPAATARRLSRHRVGRDRRYLGETGQWAAGARPRFLHRPIPDGADSRPFLFEPIEEEPIALVVRRHHPLFRRTDLTLEECLDHALGDAPAGRAFYGRRRETYLFVPGLSAARRVLGTTSTMFTLALIHRNKRDRPAGPRRGKTSTSAEQGLGSRLARLNVAPDIRVKILWAGPQRGRRESDSCCEPGARGCCAIVRRPCRQADAARSRHSAKDREATEARCGFGREMGALGRTSNPRPH